MGKLSTVRRQVIAATDPNWEDLKEAIRNLDPTKMLGHCEPKAPRMHPRWLDAAYWAAVTEKLTA